MRVLVRPLLALLRFCMFVHIRSADVTVVNATEAYASLTCVTCLLMCIRPCLLETPVLELTMRFHMTCP